jgi:hypothetical protein
MICKPLVADLGYKVMGSKVQDPGSHFRRWAAFEMRIYGNGVSLVRPDPKFEAKSAIIRQKFLKISGHQLRWPRPLPGAIFIPPALLVVAD